MRLPGYPIMAVKCVVKMQAMKFPRHLGGNNSFQKLTGYLQSVSMAQ